MTDGRRQAETATHPPQSPHPTLAMATSSPASHGQNACTHRSFAWEEYGGGGSFKRCVACHEPFDFPASTPQNTLRNMDEVDLLSTARDLLSSLEWSGTKYYDAKCCPCCRALSLDEVSLAMMGKGETCGHDPDCELNAFLCAVRPHE
jgi:hypothetical protein